jgi:hypothetical protein
VDPLLITLATCALAMLIVLAWRVLYNRTVRPQLPYSRRLYSWVETVFADYRTVNPDHPILNYAHVPQAGFTMAWQDRYTTG